MTASTRKRTGILALVAGLLMSTAAFATDWDMRGFVDCLSSSGAKYYGAHWCPYCARQNRMFGRDARYLPYIECSAPGSRRELSRCRHIAAYPTWRFADGQVRTGVLSFQTLGALTGCELREKSYFVD
jgi:hypothetical protein